MSPAQRADSEEGAVTIVFFQIISLPVSDQYQRKSAPKSKTRSTRKAAGPPRKKSLNTSATLKTSCPVQAIPNPVRIQRSPSPLQRISEGVLIRCVSGCLAAICKALLGKINSDTFVQIIIATRELIRPIF